MASNKEPVRWVTAKGARIPIYIVNGKEVFGTGVEKDEFNKIVENNNKNDVRKTDNLKDYDILVNKVEPLSEIKILKDTKQYTNFQSSGGFGTKYRLKKSTGEIQSSPYWNTLKDLYVKSGVRDKK